MNVTKIKKIITTLLAITLPYIQDLIKSKVVPAIRRKSFEAFDKKANQFIEKLLERVENIKSISDEKKKQLMLGGVKLETATLRALGNKLIDVANVLDEELAGG